jgi:cytochrome c nitrite reductase small subunit
MGKDNQDRRKRLILTGTMTICASLFGLFLLFGPPQLLARSESPEFCASCHVMKTEYNAYMHNGAHRRLKCIDCHLPNDSVASHYVWKSIDGMKDVVVFNSGRVPERITISDHGAAVVKENCIRCHQTLVSMIDTSRNCWSCHRRITHNGTGALNTL